MEPAVEQGATLVQPLFKKSWRKKWIYGGAAVIVVLGVGIPLAIHKLRATTPLPSSFIYTVRTGSITQDISTTGSIQPTQTVDLNFQGQSGVLEQLDVKIGDQVKAGQVLATVDDSAAKQQLIQAQAGVTQAQASLLSAQTKLTQTRAGTTATQIAADEQSIAKAQMTLQQAEQSYQAQVASFNDPTTAQQQLQSAEDSYQQAAQNATDTSGVTAARQQLATDETLLQQDALTQNQTKISQDTLTIQKDQNAITAAEKQVQQAQQKAAQAQQVLTQAQQQASNRTSDQQALSGAQFQVQQDKLALQSAKDTLTQDQQPPDTATVQQAEASVATAQASLLSAEAQLQSAQQTLADTTLKASISGVVAQVNGTVGEVPPASSANPLVEVVSNSNADLQVTIMVTESQITQVKSGDAVALTASAYPGVTFTGSITQVYPMPQVTNNVTQYTVIASVHNQNGDLKNGMTANADIQTAQANNVVVVPAIALQQVGTQEGVYVVDPNSSTGTGNSSSGTSGQFRGGSGSGGTSGSGSSGTSGQSGGGSGRGGGGFAGGGFGRGTTLSVNGSKLPKNVHFQVVKVGLLGTSTVQVVSGLQPGQQILIQLPSSATTTSTGATGFGGAGAAAGTARRLSSSGGGKG